MFNNANNNSRKSSKSQSRRNRSMQIEALEDRTLLSVSPLFPDAFADTPPIVAPMSAAENLAPKHELVTDLNQWYIPETKIAQATIDDSWFYSLCHLPRYCVAARKRSPLYTPLLHSTNDRNIHHRL